MLCRLPFLEETECNSWPPNSYSFIFSIWRSRQFTKRTHLVSSSRMRPFHPGRSVWWESSAAELTLVPQSHCSWGSPPLGHHHFVLYQAPWVQLIPVLTVENNTPENKLKRKHYWGKASIQIDIFFCVWLDVLVSVDGQSGNVGDRWLRLYESQKVTSTSGQVHLLNKRWFERGGLGVS